LTGVSPWGAQWEYREGDREILRRLFVSLDDRLVLSAPFDAENPTHVVASIQEIRRELTETLKRLPEGSSAVEAVRDMRAECAKFVHVYAAAAPGWFWLGLGELRATFGWQLSVLSARYDLHVNEPLSSILPPTEEEGRYLETHTPYPPSPRVFYAAPPKDLPPGVG
jgi:hypothetical protein